MIFSAISSVTFLIFTIAPNKSFLPGFLSDESSLSHATYILPINCKYCGKRAIGSSKNDFNGRLTHASLIFKNSLNFLFDFATFYICDIAPCFFNV